MSKAFFNLVRNQNLLIIFQFLILYFRVKILFQKLNLYFYKIILQLQTNQNKSQTYLIISLFKSDLKIFFRFEKQISPIFFIIKDRSATFFSFNKFFPTLTIFLISVEENFNSIFFNSSLSSDLIFISDFLFIFILSLIFVGIKFTS